MAAPLGPRIAHPAAAGLKETLFAPQVFDDRFDQSQCSFFEAKADDRRFGARLFPDQLHGKLEELRVMIQEQVVRARGKMVLRSHQDPNAAEADVAQTTLEPSVNAGNGEGNINVLPRVYSLFNVHSLLLLDVLPRKLSYKNYTNYLASKGREGAFFLGR